MKVYVNKKLMMLMVSLNEDKYYKQKLSKQLSAYDDRTAWDEWMTDSVIPSELFDAKIPSVLTGLVSCEQYWITR